MESGDTPIPNEGTGSSSPAPAAQPDSATLAARLTKPPTSTEQVSQYIRRMFQDRDGNIWFGTTSDGVARYDGRSLTYFTTADGLAGNWVSAMAQDERGDIWFATGGGISRYDGTEFTNYTMKDGLASDQVWCLLIDRKGWLWAGTEEGVSCFNPSAQLRTGGKAFGPFSIPAADLSKYPYYKYPKQINDMLQDRAGNIWFASNGGGVYHYDGKSLTNFSEKKGLCNNFVQTILEDRSGKLWFGTRYGGVCTYDGTSFTRFTGEDGLKSDHVWTLMQDQAGSMWISAISYGLCSYDGKKLTCYTERDDASLKNVQSLLEDASGQLWVGTSSGVYRFVGGKFTNWTKEDALRPG